MTFRSVLVHVEPGEAGAARLKGALAAADLFQAELIGLGAELPEPLAVADPYGMVVLEGQALLREQAEQNLLAAQARFEGLASDRPHVWETRLQPPLDALCGAARGADLIVAGGTPPDRRAPYRAAGVAKLVLRAGRPVLVAPPTPRTFRGDRILVAWKDTREARRAVADAMPFLHRAEAVVVMAACRKAELAEAESCVADVVRHLARHGVIASAKVEAAREERVCTALHIQAEAMAADLIVAGAYGHHRLQEWVFGGVTDGLLRRPERFVLMSH